MVLTFGIEDHAIYYKFLTLISSGTEKKSFQAYPIQKNEGIIAKEM